ncbi:MAG TPA: DNA gyrase modulator, partial [Gemmatimonadaceae bacterium]
MTNRRDFIKKGTLVAGAIAAEAAFRKAHGLGPLAPPEPAPPAMDAAIRDLMMDALNAAKLAGASYADVRIGRYLQNFVSTREQQITNVVDTDSIGAGVRALVNGTWGFAATRTMTKDGVASAAKRAVAVAKATAIAKGSAVELAPTPVFKDVSWKKSYQVDPWTIPVEQKADLLLKANAAALKAK